jgi:hypothetical protein
LNRFEETSRQIDVVVKSIILKAVAV